MSDTDTFRPLRESTIGALIIRIGFWGILYIVPVWRPQSSVAIGKHSAHFRTRRHQLEAPTSNSLWGGTLVIDNTRLHSEELQEPINAVCDQETSKIQPRNQETTRRPRRERHDISSAPRGHQESTNAPRKHWLSTGAPEDHEEETTKRPPRDEQETTKTPCREQRYPQKAVRAPSRVTAFPPNTGAFRDVGSRRTPRIVSSKCFCDSNFSGARSGMSHYP